MKWKSVWIGMLVAVGICSAAEWRVIEDGFMGQDGVVRKLFGVMYYQPVGRDGRHGAAHASFWENLDEERLYRDFRFIKRCGFDLIIVHAEWGAFQPDYNCAERDYGKLIKVLTTAEEAGLLVGIGLGMYAQTPHNLPAVERIDGGVISPKDYFLPTLLTDERFWRPYIDCMRGVVQATRDFPNTAFYFWTSEALTINVRWARSARENVRAWNDYLKAQEPSLSYWDRRWEGEIGKREEKWGCVSLPYHEWFGDESTSSLAKWQDYWRWHDETLLAGKMEELVRVVKEVAPEKLVGFETFARWGLGKPDWESLPLVGFDFVGIGYYPDYEKAPDASGIVEYIASVKKATRKPLFIIETGASTEKYSEEFQQEFIEQVIGLAGDEVAGIVIWQWADYLPEGRSPTLPFEQHFGIFKMGLESKEAGKWLLRRGH